MKKENVIKSSNFLKQKVIKGIVFGETAFYTATNALTVLASNGVTITVNDNVSMDSIMGEVIGLLLSIMRYVGIGFLVWGIYQLYTSYTEDNPAGKIKGITYCVVAIGLITIKTILKGFGMIA